MVDFYNEQVASFLSRTKAAGIAQPDAATAEEYIDYNPARFSWNHSDKLHFTCGVQYSFSEIRTEVAA